MGCVVVMDYSMAFLKLFDKFISSVVTMIQALNHLTSFDTIRHEPLSGSTKRNTNKYIKRITTITQHFN
jgi:hypothetical protein